METILSQCENGSTEIFPDKELSGLEYAKDVVLLSEDPFKFQVVLDLLVNRAVMFEI